MMTRRRWIWVSLCPLGVLGILGYAGSLWLSLSRRPVTGGVELQSGVGVPFYVGDRRVGTGRVLLTWSELLGRDGRPPLAILLPPDTPSVESRARDWKSLPPGAIAEWLSGPGSMIVRSSPANPPWNGFGQRHQFAAKELILRRADGSRDGVLCIDGEVTSRYTGERCAFLIPVRSRPPRGQPTHTFAIKDFIGSFRAWPRDRVELVYVLDRVDLPAGSNAAD